MCGTALDDLRSARSPLSLVVILNSGVDRFRRYLFSRRSGSMYATRILLFSLGWNFLLECIEIKITNTKKILHFDTLKRTSTNRYNRIRKYIQTSVKFFFSSLIWIQIFVKFCFWIASCMKYGCCFCQLKLLVYYRWYRKKNEQKNNKSLCVMTGRRNLKVLSGHCKNNDFFLVKTTGIIVFENNKCFFHTRIIQMTLSIPHLERRSERQGVSIN